MGHIAINGRVTGQRDSNAGIARISATEKKYQREEQKQGKVNALHGIISLLL
jgi:muconolactone delta-isomerase